MNRKFIIGLLFAALGLVAQTASAATMSWVELGFKSSHDGVVYDDPYGSWPSPAVDMSGFNSSTGLGNIKFTFSGAGTHYVVGFFDYQFVDAPLNNGLDDEYGIAHGSLASGESFGIDDPWTGSIYGDFSAFDASTPLDGINHIPATAPGDVSVALGYAFTLPGGSLDVIFRVSKTAPASGFYIEHRDPKSGDSVYFGFGPSGTGPEPATLGLLGLGLAVAARRLRRRA
jgi:hypothetical protein